MAASSNGSIFFVGFYNRLYSSGQNENIRSSIRAISSKELRVEIRKEIWEHSERDQSLLAN